MELCGLKTQPRVQKKEARLMYGSILKGQKYQMDWSEMMTATGKHPVEDPNGFWYLCSSHVFLSCGAQSWPTIEFVCGTILTRYAGAFWEPNSCLLKVTWEIGTVYQWLTLSDYSPQSLAKPTWVWTCTDEDSKLNTTEFVLQPVLTKIRMPGASVSAEQSSDRKASNV